MRDISAIRLWGRSKKIGRGGAGSPKICVFGLKTTFSAIIGIIGLGLSPKKYPFLAPFLIGCHVLHSFFLTKILNPLWKYSNYRGSANTSAWADDTIQYRNSHTPADSMISWSLVGPFNLVAINQRTALLLWLIWRGFLRNRLSTSIHTAKVGLRNSLRLLKRRLRYITPYPFVYIGKMSEPQIVGNAAMKASHIYGSED